jgi:hypothetical protein
MKNLQITYLLDPHAPDSDGQYVFYNPDIHKVWIFTGFVEWILDDAQWNWNEKWTSKGIWKYAFSHYFNMNEIDENNGEPLIDFNNGINQ